MQENQNHETQTRENTEPEPAVFQKRIGSTTYNVKVHFSQTSKETIGDKILRLIENDVHKGV